MPRRIVYVLLALLLLAPVRLPADPPATATAPSTAPASQPSMETRRRVILLMRQSMKLLRDHKNDEAEKVLQEALDLWPTETTNLYNMACIKALKGDDDDAMRYLVKAAAAGFTDFEHIESDSDLTSLHDRKDYQLLLAKKPEFLHHAAEGVIKSLKEQLGAGYIYEIDDADKLIFATNTDATTLAALKKMLIAQSRSQHVQLFPHTTDQFITVVLPSAGDFAKIVTQRGVQGFYNHENHILIARNLGFVTQHEFTHAMYFADIEPTEQEHPIWLVEGMAVLFEHAEYEPNPDDPATPLLTPQASFRLAGLQHVARMRGLIPWEQMFAMTQAQFVQRAIIAYAESGSIMDYLYEHHALRKFYDLFKANYEKDRTGKMSLELATGMKLKDLEADWKAWMLKQQPPPLRAGADGPYLGVRFGDANDGIRIEQVLREGPADKAGLHDADLVVGLNDIDVRDFQTLISLLVGHHPGEEVTLQIRRGEKYLAVPVTLGRRPDDRPATRPATRPSTRPLGRMPVPATRPAPVGQP